MSPPLHITILASALSACGVDTAAPGTTRLDAGKDAQVTTGEDAASGDASQVHEGDASSTGSDAEVSKRPCNDACSGATPYCDEASDTCVACLDSTHCAGDPSAPRCEQGACVPCETNDHCSGVTTGSMRWGFVTRAAVWSVRSASMPARRHAVRLQSPATHLRFEP